MEKILTTIDNSYHGVRVDQFLSHITTESRELIKQQADKIFVNGKTVKPSYKLHEGDKVEWTYTPTLIKEITLVGENIPLDIIFEDEHLMVVNKPAGMVVHPAKGHWTGTLSHAIAYHLNLQESSELRPGVIHRLDKDTSGLMVITKTYKAQKHLVKAFKARKILKIYTALVQGKLTTTHGTINSPIARSTKNRLLFCVDPERGKESLTEFQVIEEYSKTTLVKIRIHTGRTHQIRVHFMSIGNAIIGDILYSRFHKEPPLCLVATKLGFIHPITGEKMEFEIPVPKEIMEKIKTYQ